MQRLGQLDLMVRLFFSIFKIRLSICFTLIVAFVIEAYIQYWFQVYNIVVQHLYILWNDLHNKSSYQLSPYRVIIPYVVHYIPMAYLLYDCKVVLHNPLHLLIFCPFPHPPSLWQPPVCSLYLSVCFCLSF